MTLFFSCSVFVPISAPAVAACMNLEVNALVFTFCHDDNFVRMCNILSIYQSYRKKVIDIIYYALKLKRKQSTTNVRTNVTTIFALPSSSLITTVPVPLLATGKLNHQPDESRVRVVQFYFLPERITLIPS